MKITPSLVKKFLDNRCTAAEAKAVARYLQQHPETMAMHVKASWDAAGQETGLPPGYAEEMLEVINTQIGQKTRVVRFRWFAAAASVFVPIIAGWLFNVGTGSAKRPLATTTIKKRRDSVIWKQHTSTTGKFNSLTLPAGTLVSLTSNPV
jgi:hypothetical protein